MSWQSYVDANLLGTQKINQAAIVGAQGGVWATSEGFEISQTEQEKILQAHANSEDVEASGLVIAGVKYFCLSANGRSIYLKKGADGAVVVKTNLAILCCIYKPPTQGPEAATVVEGLADYLLGVGF
ncbi:profilin [Lentinula aciculospora]|uniref:Profilin n=1 Tax=Lentinula aciculospora TaxID=153920 RepID=A0A9W9DSJ1_9AGAR|nr:profilin [Lentinula aciculospora]